MTAGTIVLRETSEPFGSRDVRYSCSCGYATDAYPIHRVSEADDEIRGHLADEHSDELKVGRCARCGRPTDWLRAHSPELGEDAYLCEIHAPRRDLAPALGAPESSVTE